MALAGKDMLLRMIPHLVILPITIAFIVDVTQ
jgi:hypothetical protein